MFKTLLLIVIILLQLSTLFVLYVKFPEITSEVEKKLGNISSLNLENINGSPMESNELAQQKSENQAQASNISQQAGSSASEAPENNPGQSSGQSPKGAELVSHSGNPEVSSSLLQNLLKVN
ncbi:uncharacterized protein VICG_02056 [Vittaforma corneae ATCC 50505]|uniref:Uncharacterized protein n=1 Tax=Vittaforma corneae (strain ATCC 50505) TaxID=993615 RepID=L2GJ76_VITCO|nr:uncharacterized protein VICG_02056 [Vittaforma corneae ATCC 50505]ELA40916.1 hypothetical protein VICG_02056 [Vittaforma corneae ATCC 50505]